MRLAFGVAHAPCDARGLKCGRATPGDNVRRIQENWSALAAAGHPPPSGTPSEAVQPGRKKRRTTRGAVATVDDDDGPSALRPLASAVQFAPVPWDLEAPATEEGPTEAELAAETAAIEAVINEWSTERAPAAARGDGDGTSGKVDEVLTTIKCTLNAFRGLPKPPRGRSSQDPLRPTLDNIVYTMAVTTILGGLLAELHVLRVVEEFERRKAAKCADADKVLHPLNNTFFCRCLRAVSGLRPEPDKKGSEETREAFPFLLETAAIFRRTCEEAVGSYQPPDLEHLHYFMDEAARDMETVTKTYYKREFFRRLKQNAQLELGCSARRAYSCARAVLAVEFVRRPAAVPTPAGAAAPPAPAADAAAAPGLGDATGSLAPAAVAGDAAAVAGDAGAAAGDAAAADGDAAAADGDAAAADVHAEATEPDRRRVTARPLAYFTEQQVEWIEELRGCMPKRPKKDLWETYPHLCLPLAKRLLAKRERVAPAAAQAPESSAREEPGEATQLDASRTEGTGASTAGGGAVRELGARIREVMHEHDPATKKRRGLGKKQRAAAAERRERAAERQRAAREPAARRHAARGPATADPPKPPPPQRHVGRLFGLLPCKQGYEAAYVTGTLSSLRGLLRRHEVLNHGSVAELTGMNLPTKALWCAAPMDEVLARLNLEGCRLPPGKEAAIRACLLAKQKWHKKKKALCVHIGWAFFARLFDYRRFEHGRWTSGGHWRTNGYTVAVTLQRPRDPPRPGDPPPPPPKEAKAGKRNNAGASKGALHHQSREIANEHYRHGLPLTEAEIHMVVGMDPGRVAMFTAVDEHGNSTACGAKEFYAMAQHRQHEKTISGWLDKAPPCVQNLRKCPTFKTASIEALLRRVKAVVQNLQEGLAWMFKKPFRKLRHRAHLRREWAINRLAEQFRAPPGMTTVVGAGNWSAQDRGGVMRGHPPGPWMRFLKRLRRVCTVVVVDEFRSSKLCCACHTALHAHQYRRVHRGVLETGDVWGTKRCANRACAANVANRDVNAAVNMLMLVKLFLAGLPRPTAFGGPPPLTAPTNGWPTNYTNCA